MSNKISLHKDSLFDDEELKIDQLVDFFINKYKEVYCGTEGRYVPFTQNEKKNLILLVSYISGIYPDVIKHHNTLYGMDYDWVTQRITMQILFSSGRATFSQMHQTFRLLETFKYVLEKQELPDGSHFHKFPIEEDDDDDDC